MTRATDPAHRQSQIIHIEWDGPYRFWDHPRQLDPALVSKDQLIMASTRFTAGIRSTETAPSST